MRRRRSESEGREGKSQNLLGIQKICVKAPGEKKIPLILEQRAKGKQCEVQHIGAQTRKIIQFNLHP